MCEVSQENKQIPIILQYSIKVVATFPRIKQLEILQRRHTDGRLGIIVFVYR